MLSDVIKGKIESQVYSLKSNNVVKGFRVKIFNEETRQFVYYDFNMDTLGQDKKVRSYLECNYDNFDSLDLNVDPKDNLLKTSDEMDGSINVISFSDVNEAVNVISQIAKIDEVRSDLKNILKSMGK